MSDAKGEAHPDNTFFEELRQKAKELKVEYSEAQWDYRWAVKKELPEDFAKTCLYHYTSQAGAHGILTSKSIWATDAFFLNDPQEVAWGRKALRTAYEQLDNDTQEEFGRVLTSLTEVGAEDGRQFAGLLRNRAYTVSFSTNGDALRQWRAYGGTRGVALGFNLKLLANTQPDVLLAPVLYKDQKTLAERFYHDLLSTVNRGKRDQLSSSALCDRLIERYATFLPLAKNPDYEDEEEWRLVIPGYKVPENLPRWHSGVSYTTPHITIGLWENGEYTELPNPDENQVARERHINRVVLPVGCRAVMGPEAHPLAKQFLDKMLKGAVGDSEIEFRSP